jgi:hypothetical protein
MKSYERLCLKTTCLFALLKVALADNPFKSSGAVVEQGGSLYSQVLLKNENNLREFARVSVLDINVKQLAPKRPQTFSQNGHKPRRKFTYRYTKHVI